MKATEKKLKWILIKVINNGNIINQLQPSIRLDHFGNN